MAAERAADADHEIEASCCEVYNEAVADLLAADRQQQQRPMQVRLFGGPGGGGPWKAACLHGIDDACTCHQKRWFALEH
jgi:hypothetical protein